MIARDSHPSPAQGSVHTRAGQNLTLSAPVDPSRTTSGDGSNGYPQAGEVVHTGDITPTAGIASADPFPPAAAGAHEVRPAAVSGRDWGDAPGRLAAADATAPGDPDATHDPVLVYQAEACESCGRPWFYRIHGALDRAGRIHDETAARLARPESWTEAERRAAWGDR